MSIATADYKWLWCDDHAKVTEWFSSQTDRHEYPLFYASFINTANRSWGLYSRSTTQAKMQPLDHLIVDCLSRTPIPADMLIEALSGYNKRIGGTKSSLKGKGLVKFEDGLPEMSTFESAVTEFRKKIAIYYKKKNAQQEAEEDEEMEDAEVENEQGKQPTEFTIAIVGGRKKDDDGDEDMS